VITRGPLVLAAAAVASVWSVGAAFPSRRPLPHATIVVRPRGVVSGDDPGVPHAEPWLAVDPHNPSRAIAVGLAAGGNQSVAYSTADGGASWRRGVRDSSEQRFPGGDPIVAFDDDGMALLATISPFRVWRSSDGGVTWQGPAIVPGRSYDREYLAVQPAPNAPDTIFTLAKTPIRVFGHHASDALALSRSTDGGGTFEAPRLLLPDPTKSIIHVAGGLVVAPNGNLFVSFMAHDAPVTDPVTIKNHVWVLHSTDGGRTFDEPVVAAPSVIYGNKGDELKMLKSLAAARIVMDTARASRYRGRLYVSYLTAYDGRLQVMVVASADSGRTWAAPVRVNDDTGASNHSNPQIAVNDRGVVAVTWNDRRADPDDLCFRATVSASVDGGATFLPSVPMDTTRTCPLGPSPRRPLDLGGFTGRYVQGGETQGLAALPGGRFLAVYVAGSAMQLRSATVEIVDGGRSR
jgi:hypothetical protein